MNICVGITTYNRPEQYRDTVKAIRANAGSHNVKIVVVQDGGRRYVKDGTDLYTHHKHHGGKAGYSDTVTILWAMAEASDPDVFIQVPDDFTFGQGWISKAVNTLSMLDRYAAINIHACGRTNMWGIRPHSRGAFDSNAFIDGAFAITADAMDLIDWEPAEVPETYHRDGLGSGVWRYTTKAMRKMGIRIFRMRDHIVTTDWSGANSQMNPHR